MLVCEGRVYISCTNYLVITIVIVVDWRMNLLNEVEVLTTRLSKDIFRPTHYKTNLKQGAHTLYTQTHGLASTSRTRTAISPRQWQSWTAVSPLLGSSVWHSRNSTQPVKNKNVENSS